jgi:hypothetical protein
LAENDAVHYTIDLEQAEAIANDIITRMSLIIPEQKWTLNIEAIPGRRKRMKIGVFTKLDHTHTLFIEIEREAERRRRMYIASLVYQPINEFPQRVATIAGETPQQGVVILLEAVRSHAVDRLHMCDTVLGAIPKHHHIMARKRIQAAERKQRNTTE